jgi:hypothetical protein
VVIRKGRLVIICKSVALGVERLCKRICNQPLYL